MKANYTASHDDSKDIVLLTADAQQSPWPISNAVSHNGSKLKNK